MAKWTCPECGNSKLGPQRPRKENIIRYCLPCSEASGKLVERRNIAQESRAAAKSARARKRAAERAARAKAKEDAKWIVHFRGRPIDLRKEASRIWRCKEAKRLRRKNRLPNEMPRFTIARSRSKAYGSGRCYMSLAGARRIHVTTGVDSPKHGNAADALYVLAHELAHACCSPLARHNKSYQAAVLDIVNDAFDADVRGYRNGWSVRQRATNQIHDYLAARFADSSPWRQAAAGGKGKVSIGGIEAEVEGFTIERKGDRIR